MDSKLVEDVEARIEFIKLALKHCGKCEDETCSACGFYETELGILKRCLESLRWIPIDQSAPNKFIGLLKDGGWGVFHKPKEPEDFQKMIDVYGIVGWMIPPTIAGE